MNIKNVLKESIPQRQNEMAMYSINITNFTRAIELIDNSSWDDPNLAAAMQEYKTYLLELKQQNIVEREKTRILYDVIIAQLEE
jgi:hypothetical protein